MQASATESTQSEKAPLKSQFIASHPNLSTGELIALAAKRGIKLSAGHVYSVRHSLRKAKQPNGAARASAPSAKAAQLRQLLIEVGLDAAEAILDDVRSFELRRQ